MSLADILRYKLSEPPTLEELAALPVEVLCHFNATALQHFEFIHYEAALALIILDAYPADISFLRDLILGHDA